MHTLYAIDFTCSFAVHLLLRQHQLPFTLTWLERGPARKVATEAFVPINPKRKVPALLLPDGELLTEVVSVLHHLDQTCSPMPPAQQRRSLEWLCFIATELHQQVLAPTFDPALARQSHADARDRLLPPVLAVFEARLAAQPTLLGGSPTGADAYLFWGLVLLRYRWPRTVQSPALTRFMAHMSSQPFVQQTLAVEQAQRKAA